MYYLFSPYSMKHGALFVRIRDHAHDAKDAREQCKGTIQGVVREQKNKSGNLHGLPVIAKPQRRDRGIRTTHCIDMSI